MTETKRYEEGIFTFEFVPEGGPFEGRLATRYPELPPYVANLNLASTRSRNGYAKEAAEFCGADEPELKAALIAVCATRNEEVSAASEAEGAGPLDPNPKPLKRLTEALRGC